MSKGKVVLVGDGVAAACAASLLAGAKIDYVLHAKARPKLATILLGTQTQHLLSEVFAADQSETSLFQNFVRITQRMVLWGNAKEPIVLPHAGVVAPEEELLQRLWNRVPSEEKHDTALSEDDWTIISSRDSIQESVSPEWNYGQRMARFAQVELNSIAEEGTCWVESVRAGWLFMLSLGNGIASLIAVGANADELLPESRLVAPRVNKIMSESNPIASYPRVKQKLVEEKRIFCGGAAMNFDPLCGEGAGNAAREAFLAVAIIKAALAGEELEPLGQHYTARLLQGFERHLELCLHFYSSGGEGSFWQMECDALRKGVTELRQTLSFMPTGRYKLVDRDLVPLVERRSLEGLCQRSNQWIFRRLTRRKSI